MPVNCYISPVADFIRCGDFLCPFACKKATKKMCIKAYIAFYDNHTKVRKGKRL
nr:MAG TPA: hypothetical protein [Caudoviricetes sp.]